MSKIFTVEPNEFIKSLAEELKSVKEIQPPEWSKFCKTGVHKERCPIEADWWHVRAAAVLRSIFRLGPIGTEKLRTKYGGRKDRGNKPEHQRKGSGSVIRKILQQLEAAKLVKQEAVGVHKGRVVTKEGKTLLNKVADIKPVKAESKNDSVQNVSDDKEKKAPEVKEVPKEEVKTDKPVEAPKEEAKLEEKKEEPKAEKSAEEVKE